jgi:hypothetical protein
VCVHNNRDMHPTRGTRIHPKGLQSPLEECHPTGRQGQIKAPFAGTICSPFFLKPLLFEHGREALNQVRIHKTARAGVSLNVSAGRTVYRRAGTRKTLAAVRWSARMQKLEARREGDGDEDKAGGVYGGPGAADGHGPGRGGVGPDEIGGGPGTTDDLALVAVLRSPFFALDDGLLHDLAAKREKGTSWWQQVRESGDSRLDVAKEVLGDLLTKRRLEPPTALLQLADRLTGYTAVIANLPGAGRREADWRGFRELAGDLERGSDDAFTVVRWLRQLHEAEAQVPRPPIEAGDAVSLMTIHAAKGLEWPVVVIPDLARAMPSSSGTVAFDPELGVSVDFGEEEGAPALHRLIRDKKARLEEDETRRVFYVAPTRARDHLIPSCTGLTERLCGLTVLQPGLELADIAVSPVPYDEGDARPPELPSPLPAEPAGLLLTPAETEAEVVT